MSNKYKEESYNDDIVKLLVENGADLNIVCKKGCIALMLAIHYGYLNVAKLLIDNAADVNVVNTKNETALSIAISKGRLDIVEILKDNGVK